MRAKPRPVTGRDIKIYALGILVGVVLILMVTSVARQYSLAVSRTELQLAELARAQAWLMESVAKYDAIHAGPEGWSRQSTLSEIREAHYRYHGFGRTGEIVLAETRDSMIHFLLPQPSIGFRIPDPVKLGGARSLMISEALAGNSGVHQGLDSQGHSVLEAFEWLPFLGVALGVKMDMAEIRAPIIRQVVVISLVGLVLIVIGVVVHGRMVDPLVNQVFQANADLEHQVRVAKTLAEEARRGQEIALTGESVPVQALRTQIDRFAKNEEPVLLGGPPGSGQEAVARALHEASARSGQVFIVVDCTRPVGEDTTPLLGISRGGTEGKAYVAEGGTLYLEMVGSLSPEHQEGLANLIKTTAEARARGEQPKPDVRIIAYLPADPAAAVAGGELHPRLAAALGRQRLVVPSLAERRDDIEVLALRMLQGRARALGKTASTLSKRAVRTLVEYSWPGNLRELQAVVERATLHSVGTEVDIEEDLKAETRSLGGYKLIRLLGRGGMGEVWLGEHALLKRPAAIKITQLAMAETPEARVNLEKRFRREAEVTSQLRSPHTVELFDFGVTEDGQFYYVMECLEGFDLDVMVRRHGVLPPERAAHLVRQACLSLAEAHDLGMIHRDIKPENMFACRMGYDVDFVKVLDFGIVKRVKGGSSGPDSTRTATGLIVGTPAYIAPEVATGKDPTAQSDIYALGCVLYRLVTGRVVFEGDTPMATFLAHVEHQPEPPSAVAPQPIPGEFEQVIMECLRKDRTQRPQSAMELRTRLGQVKFAEPWTEARALAWWQSLGAGQRTSGATVQMGAVPDGGPPKNG